VQQAEGVRIKGITTVEYNSYSRAKSKRQIRYILRNNNTKGLGERLAINFYSYKVQSITKEKSQMLVTDRFLGL
jgi:hypothetical protein